MKKTLLFLFAFVLAAVNMVAQNEVVLNGQVLTLGLPAKLIRCSMYRTPSP